MTAPARRHDKLGDVGVTGDLLETAAEPMTSITDREEDRWERLGTTIG